MRVVLDNSVAVPLFAKEEWSLKAKSLFEIGCDVFLAPSFLAVEFANVMIAGVRRRRWDESHALELLRGFEELKIDFFEHPTSDYQDACKLGFKYELSMYDALYLYLAKREHAMLASFDKKLCRAAKSEDLEVWNAN